MLLNNTFSSLIYYFNHFKPIDYISFIWFGILIFLFLILGILLLKKHMGLAVFILFSVLILGICGPFFIKWYLNNSIRKSEFNLIQSKQLNFTNTFVISGKLMNLSKKNFSTCKIYIGFYKNSKNKIKNYINKIKPEKTYIKTTKETLLSGESTDVKMVLNNFKIAKDVNISSISECYK